MRRRASVLLVLGLAAAALAAGVGPATADALDECWEQAETRLELGLCLEAAEAEAAEALAAVDKALDAAEAAIDNRLGRHEASRALERSRLAFELFRDLDCELVGLQAGSGTGAGDFRRACWIDRTRQRTLELETLVENMSGNPEASLPEGRIEGGTWLAEDIQSRGVMDYLQTTLEVSGGGEVTGTGGCNNYFGEADIDGDRIRFGALGSTRMACPEAVMDQESRYFAALELVRRWRVEPTGLLHLLDEDGVTVVRFSRQS